VETRLHEADEVGVCGQRRRGLDTQTPKALLLRMPVVDASSTLDLMPYLGDRAPSSLHGGFRGITDQQQLVISQAAQQGVLTIDEDGTLAAAVTEMAMAGSAPVEPPFELIVDRPYLVRIADEQTGWPLFFAHVAAPRSEE
jgi:serpin B